MNFSKEESLEDIVVELTKLNEILFNILKMQTNDQEWQRDVINFIAVNEKRYE